MPPRRATTLRAPCALDGAASRLHVPSAFATVGALERCPSGRRGTPGERVYPQGTEGSNPSLSACQLIWGPVQCSPRVARLRASDAPRPRRPARALSRSASHSSGGPSAARVRFAHAAHPTPARLRRAPQTPAVGAAPLGASLPLPCASRPRRLLYGLPRGRRAVAARSCARRRREPRQVRKEAAGRWRLGPAQEGVANPVRSGRKQRYRMSSCAAGRPSRYRRTPRASTQ